jgi:bla regulator protein blaR1
MSSMITAHIWQSTLFAGAAGLLTLALKRNRARTRYGVWLIGLVKFLVPFGLLVSLGGHFSLPRWTPKTSVIVEPAISFVMGASPLALTAAAAPKTTSDPLPMILFGAWACGFVAVIFCWGRRWTRIYADVRRASRLPIEIGIPVVASPVLCEPGVFGIFRPVLMLPEGMAEHLSKAEWEAILAHEMCHVRCRDNLTAVIYMLVESVFWFHPLVWWMGTRLVAERERACDEEVLRLGSDPKIYAEGILKVCELYLESPLQCVAGVTGSNLRQRIRAIMTNPGTIRMSTAKKLLLAAAGMLAVTLPIVVGGLHAQSAPRPKFEVASIKTCSEPLNDGGPHSSPGRLATDCAQLLNLIGNAYNTFADGHLNLNAEPAPVTGGPPWIHTTSYDINAKAEGNPSQEMMFGPMMQALLEDRFQLKIHRQTSEGPVYFLTVARGGPKLQPFTEGSCTLYYGFPRPPLAQGQTYCERTISGLKPSVQADGATLDEFSKTLRMVVGRPVIDKTGISGRFNLLVKFSREGTELGSTFNDAPLPAADPTGPPSIFTAIQEQLGLRLEAGKGPVDFLFIDHIERPSEN